VGSIPAIAISNPVSDSSDQETLRPTSTVSTGTPYEWLRNGRGRSPQEAFALGVSLADAKAEFEVGYLKAAMKACDGNLAAAARRSGMDRSNFRRLLKRYGLHQADSNGKA
jgi:DNA-binding NtrC family response regulator